MSTLAATSKTPAPATAAWRRVLPVLMLAWVAEIVLFIDSLSGMVEIWSRSGTFAHAYLVAPISLWLVWRLRQPLSQMSPRASPAWLLPMGLVAFGWLLGEVAGVNALTHGTVTAMLVLTVPLVLGSAVARQIMFPLGFLFFMVPFGDFMMPMMMDWTADFTVAALQLTGIPVYREGLQFVIPSGNWSVVEACSGVRYLIASFMVGTLFAYLNFQSWRRRAAFWVVSLATPIVANWLRAYMIVMLGHLSGNRLAVGVDHLIYGWLFFGVVVGLMFLIGSRWAQDPPELPSAPNGTDPEGRAAMPAWAAGAAAVAIAALPHAGVRFLDGPTDEAPARIVWPELASQQRTNAALPLTPVFEGASATAHAAYQKAGDTVWVHVAYYRNQGKGHKLVSSDHVLVKSTDNTWNRSRSGSAQLALAGETVTLKTHEVLAVGAAGDPRPARLEVRQIYWVGGRLTASGHAAAAWALFHRLTGRGDAAAAISYFLPGEAGPATARRIDEFVALHLPAMQAALAASGAGR